MLKSAILVLALLAPLPILGQDGFTGLLMNGRVWMSLEETEKKMYMFGVRDGVVAANRNESKTLIQGFTLHDYLNELNLLYEDRSNINIPVIIGIRYCSLKFKGTLTKAELEEKLIGFREATAEFSHKSPPPQ